MANKFNRSFKATVILPLLLVELKKSKSFDMCAWSHGKSSPHGCGTPACIGGHLAFILERLGVKDEVAFRRDSVTKDILVNDVRKIGEYISADYAQAFAMFKPYLRTEGFSFMAHKGDKGYISKQRAIQMLERFIETNQVIWSTAK